VQLEVAQTIADTEAEGPGRRFALWVQGCPLRCPGCCNPQMLPFGRGDATDVSALAAEIVATPGIEGVSFLGGEPFAQPGPLAALAALVRPLSVMIYTGFTLEELRARNDTDTDALLASADVVVDGPYRREEPESARRWIGSRNQGLHFLTDRYRADDARFRMQNTVEIRLKKGELVVNGWPALAAATLEKRRR